LAVAGEEEGGEAELVGAEEAGVGVGEALDDLRAGMAKGVVAADGDDGIPRGNEGEELRGGGGAAAVMADFEQGVWAELGCRVDEGCGDHLMLAGSLSVALEQGGGAAEL
jgi:hypothetical protein